MFAVPHLYAAARPRGAPVGSRGDPERADLQLSRPRDTAAALHQPRAACLGEHRQALVFFFTMPRSPGGSRRRLEGGAGARELRRLESGRGPWVLGQPGRGEQPSSERSSPRLKRQDTPFGAGRDWAVRSLRAARWPRGRQGWPPRRRMDSWASGAAGDQPSMSGMVLERGGPGAAQSDQSWGARSASGGQPAARLPYARGLRGSSRWLSRMNGLARECVGAIGHPTDPVSSTYPMSATASATRVRSPGRDDRRSPLANLPDHRRSAHEERRRPEASALSIEHAAAPVSKARS